MKSEGKINFETVFFPALLIIVAIGTPLMLTHLHNIDQVQEAQQAATIENQLRAAGLVVVSDNLSRTYWFNDVDMNGGGAWRICVTDSNGDCATTVLYHVEKVDDLIKVAQSLDTIVVYQNPKVISAFEVIETDYHCWYADNVAQSLDQKSCGATSGIVTIYGWSSLEPG